jgi:hypothetical protein
MVRAHRPHWALHPRQPYTWLVDRRDAELAALRTSWSLNTLQEQTIIRHLVGYSLTGVSLGVKIKTLFKSVLNYCVCGVFVAERVQ